MSTSTNTAGSSSPAPSALSLSRALLTAAKGKKGLYWKLEISATVIAVAGSFLPCSILVLVATLLSVGLKALNKFVVSSDSKKLFRSGERLRRYDFYERAMGWPVPSTDRADMVIALAATDIRASAISLAAAETDYYAHKGPAGPERLVCNLCESMFWTERLMGKMSKVRWKHFSFATVALILALVGAVLVQAEADVNGLAILKTLSSLVALLVALDIFGEAKSFARGEQETRRLLDAIQAVMVKAPVSRDETMRLMVEYNCLLADLPLLPDSIYEKYKDTFNAAWNAFEKSLPVRCGASA